MTTCYIIHTSKSDLFIISSLHLPQLQILILILYNCMVYLSLSLCLSLWQTMDDTKCLYHDPCWARQRETKGKKSKQNVQSILPQTALLRVEYGFETRNYVWHETLSKIAGITVTCHLRQYAWACLVETEGKKAWLWLQTIDGSYIYNCLLFTLRCCAGLQLCRS